MSYKSPKQVKEADTDKLPHSLSYSFFHYHWADKGCLIVVGAILYSIKR